MARGCCPRGRRLRRTRRRTRWSRSHWPYPRCSLGRRRLRRPFARWRLVRQQLGSCSFRRRLVRRSVVRWTSAFRRRIVRLRSARSQRGLVGLVLDSTSASRHPAFPSPVSTPSHVPVTTFAIAFGTANRSVPAAPQNYSRINLRNGRFARDDRWVGLDWPPPACLLQHPLASIELVSTFSHCPLLLVLDAPIVKNWHPPPWDGFHLAAEFFTLTLE